MKCEIIVKLPGLRLQEVKGSERGVAAEAGKARTMHIGTSSICCRGELVTPLR